MKEKQNIRIAARAYGGRRVFSLLLCLLIFLSGLTAASAAQPANNRTANAGVFYFDGYHMEDEDGSLTGYGVEFLNLVSQDVCYKGRSQKRLI